jgi:hypothetical protein
MSDTDSNVTSRADQQIRDR